MLKDIIVHVDDAAHASPSARIAAGLAARSGAHLLGVHCVNLPSVPAMVDFDIPDDIRKAQREMFESAAEAARETFEAACAAADTPGQWLCETGAPVSLLARHALVSDLLVVRRTHPDAAGQSPATLAGDVVLSTRRPVLVVPPDCAVEDMVGPMTVAWNDSPESARAIADAMPVLALASAVHVVWVSPDDPAQAQGSLDRLCSHLDRHEVSSSGQIIEGPTDAAPALLDFARRNHSRCVVIGAYGHSRMRELLFGGVTEHMLHHSELPVLMSH